MINYTSTCNTTCNGMISRVYRPQPSKRFRDRVQIAEKKESIEIEKLKTIEETIYSAKLKGQEPIKGGIEKLKEITGIDFTLAILKLENKRYATQSKYTIRKVKVLKKYPFIFDGKTYHYNLTMPEIMKIMKTHASTFSANKDKKAFIALGWIISSIPEILESKYLSIMPYYAKVGNRFYFHGLPKLLKITGNTIDGIKSKDGISQRIAKTGFVKCQKGIIYGREYK
ncbi:MAG: hypothetical protein B6229_10605 [Spirochaetaceae bacterium 4572_7]|nr:MAG: hypothetical protein B6229_10605 [Spirochaetaceae bacterium 4572_7]